ncbi:EamA family transporter [Streptoalloteichus tenebrarius]|nr:EamA family transporter [Streptoalloteichus tenebrarius]
MLRTTRSLSAKQLPAPVLFLVGGCSMYFGAGVAVRLFDQLTPSGVAWLRLLGAAVVLLAWRRPGRDAWRGRRLVLAGVFGLTTALMNVVFYEAIARLPLGTAVAVEFAGPVAVAAFGTRTRRDLAALALVVLGVGLIVDVRWSGSATGVVLAISAAALWAGYILVGKRVATGGNGLDDLAVGFAVATVLLSPLAWGTGSVWGSPSLLGLAVGVGVLSSVVPYAIDQIVLRRVGQARFALLLALLPATATLMGLVTLWQVPSLSEALGIGAVVGGVALRSREGTRQDERAPAEPGTDPDPDPSSRSASR